MPTKTKKRPLKTRTPSRVKKRKPTTRRASPQAAARPSHQHPELVGLALLAVGIFLASVLYLGVGGGVGGTALVARDRVRRRRGGLRRSAGARRDRRPDALPQLHGRRPPVPARADGVRDRPPPRRSATPMAGRSARSPTTESAALGRPASSSSACWRSSSGRSSSRTSRSAPGCAAPTRPPARSAHGGRGGHAASRVRARAVLPEPVALAAALAPPIDAVSDFPDALHDEAATDPVSVAPPLLPEREPLEEDPPTLFDLGPVSAHSDYKLPDRTVLRRSPEKAGPRPRRTSASATRSSRRSATSASTHGSAVRSRARA